VLTETQVGAAQAQIAAWASTKRRKKKKMQGIKRGEGRGEPERRGRKN
jgi:hypothetical protein